MASRGTGWKHFARILCAAMCPSRRAPGTSRWGLGFVALIAGGTGVHADTAAAVARNQFSTEADVARWKQWSPRAEIAPGFSFDPHGGREGRGALKIAARAASDFGAWRGVLEGLQPGSSYRFNAWYRTEKVDDERRSVITRLQWLDASGKPVKNSVRPPEYAMDSGREGRWVNVEAVLSAPEGATALDVQLSLGFDSDGVVWWDSVALTAVESTQARVIRAMTVHHRPRNSPSREASVEAFCRLVEQASAQRPDIVCLPEGMTVIGTRSSYVDVSEPIPGPTTERLGALAKKLNAYIVAGLYERAAPAVYNTAVLIDRQGQVAGRYRKTHLPREEWEAGLTPGDHYPVFTTDFGKIGLLVCWDVQFPEPWRALGLQGAELILLPIWGGNETLLRARAIENHAFVVSSSYDMKSCVVAPDGEILTEATPASPVAVTEVHLDRKIYQPWLGDMSTRTWKERRGDLTP